MPKAVLVATGIVLAPARMYPILSRAPGAAGRRRRS